MAFSASKMGLVLEGAGAVGVAALRAGVVRPDAGTTRWNGEVVTIDNPAKARALGIGMVFQQFSLFETLTVGENIALALDKSRAGRERGPRTKIDDEIRFGLFEFGQFTAIRQKPRQSLDVHSTLPFLLIKRRGEPKSNPTVTLLQQSCLAR